MGGYALYYSSFTNGKLSSAVLQSEATSAHPTIHTVNRALKSNMEIELQVTENDSGSPFVYAYQN